MPDRGKIIHRKRKQQINDFSGLLFHRNITPTDIDLFLDFSGNAFVIGEGKLEGCEISKGQKRLIENVCNKLKCDALGLFWVHTVFNCEEDINTADCKVLMFFYSGKWHVETRNRSVKMLIDDFIKMLIIKNIKI